MTSVEEFIATRISIETLATQIGLCFENKAVQDSKQHLDEAVRQLEVLKAMVANDVQVIVAGRLSRQLAVLGTKVETMAAKTTVKRIAARRAQQKTVRAASKSRTDVLD